MKKENSMIEKKEIKMEELNEKILDEVNGGASILITLSVVMKPTGTYYLAKRLLRK